MQPHALQAAEMTRHFLLLPLVFTLGLLPYLPELARQIGAHAKRPVPPAGILQLFPALSVAVLRDGSRHQVLLSERPNKPIAPDIGKESIRSI